MSNIYKKGSINNVILAEVYLLFKQIKKKNVSHKNLFSYENGSLFRILYSFK